WRAPAFWEVLAGDGLRTACIGWPATAPASRWPGCHVDDRFGHATGSDFDSWALPPDAVTPSSLRSTLRELRIHPADGLRDQVAALLPEASTIELRHDQRPLLLQAALAQVGTIHAAATHLAESPWDVLCVCHGLLECIVAGRQAGDALWEGPYARLLQRAYTLHDMMLGRLLQLAGPGATTMVLSVGGAGAGPHANGFLVAGGAGIVTGPLIGAAATDLAPSILARFGLAVASDGMPLAAITSSGQSLRPATPASAPEAASPTGVLGGEQADLLDSAQAGAIRHLASVRALNLAEVLLARGLVGQAADTLEGLRRSQPDNAAVLQRLAECRAMLGDADACLPLAIALLEALPTDPWGHVAMGAWHVLKQDHRGAAPHLAQAAALAPAHPLVFLRLGGLHLLRGDPAAAEAAFLVALAAEPEMADALFGLGAALAAQGRPAEAEAPLRASLTRQHLRPQAHLQLGMILMALNRWREAIGAFDVARAQQPGLKDIDAALTEARAGLAHQAAATVIRDSR
ncbi:MAG: tetratricopeptide repeat protein, partial [Rubritepida sp.]|nr:tetratricopeptide repeat protein [Rubritepida sp.]